MDEKVKEIYSMCALYEPLAYDALQQFTNCNVPCLYKVQLKISQHKTC